MRTAAALLLVLLAGCSNLAYDYALPESTYVVRAGDTLYSIAWRHGIDHRDLARWNNIADVNRIYVGQRLTLSPGARPQSAPRPVVAITPEISERPAFNWPARGDIVARFGERGTLATGIGIAGPLGADVDAAAPGRVVYAGSGLVDYGQLVIIQHNESWLTAYGHNQRLLVTQGEVVDRGQKIAEIGLGPGRQPRLYFEIRFDGDPLDPLTYLPAFD
ncbi:MAG: peptidoglycan DD-metalloendopeptidase family protein [Gammaproteobacteria bacterium]|jgi:lipoprotein NlpD